MPDIVITLTVKDLKHGKRPIIVSAAPAGEMPLILTGYFQDLETIIRAAWMQVLTRKPKVVKVAGDKKVAGEKSPGAAKSQTPPQGEAFDDEPGAEETSEAPAPEADQLVRPEDLPAIEGDAEEPAETEWDKLEDPDDRNAPSAQPAPDEEQLPLIA